MNKFCLFSLLICFSSFAYSQNRILSGTVIDTLSGEFLSDAHISVYKSNGKVLLDQAISGKRGDFSFSGLPAEDIRIVISFVGYKFLEKEISLMDNDLTDLEFKLENSPVPVGEVKVNALRQEKQLKNVSLPLTLVNMKQIEKNAAITIADVLKNEPGLAIARDGIWATSLNIRGMTEQRIVILIDGNRIETATDIAAGLAMVDVNDIERIEVIKGAASSLYGTGAMGGVINIITRDGYFNNGFYTKGSITGLAQSVNNMHSENVSVNLGNKSWYISAGGTYRNALNTMTPKGELLNSQFRDNNLSLKAALKPKDNHELKINYQRFFAKDVGIPGGSSFPGTAVATYPVELRDMISAGYTIKNSGKKLEEFQVKYFHQYILRDVELIPGPAVTITPSGFHKTNGVLMQTNWNLGQNNKLIAGLDIWQRFLETEREKKITQQVLDSSGNVISTKFTVIGELPIPDAWFTSGGLFIRDQFFLAGKKLEISLGGRLDLINIRNEKAIDPVYIIVNEIRNNNPPDQRISFDAGNVNNTSWSADISFLYHALPGFDLTLNTSRAFRSPSLEERFKYIDLGTTVKIGDPDLKPEDGYFIDFGSRIWKDRFQLSGNLFINSMRNLIIEIPGFAYYNYTNQPGRTDTVNALINSNVDQAILYGFDLISNYNFFDGFTLTGSASFVRGRDTRNETDLPLIPPLSGRLGIRYKIPKLFGTEFYMNLVADQDKIGSGEKESTGYASYDLNIYSAPIKLDFAELKIFGGIENITDRAYINHLGTNRGIVKYEPGRNFYVRMRVEF